MNQPKIITLRGPSDVLTELQSLDDFSAGIYGLASLNKVYPGITWAQAIQKAKAPARMNGWFTDLSKAAGSTIDFIGEKLKDTVTVVGEIAGSGVRLATDEKVIDGASRIGAAYATNGGSEGLKQLLGDKAGQNTYDFFASLGSTLKDMAGQGQGGSGVNAASAGFGGIPPLAWVAAGGVTLLVLLRRR